MAHATDHTGVEERLCRCKNAGSGVKDRQWLSQNKFSHLEKVPFRLLSCRLKYFIFISWSIHLEKGEQDIRYVHLQVSGAKAVARQTRSLPGSTGFSQQHIITHNNINSYSSRTQNGLLVFIWSHVCLPSCLQLKSISDNLSVNSCCFTMRLSILHFLFALYVES